MRDAGGVMPVRFSVFGFRSPSSKFMEEYAAEALRAGGKRRRRCALPAHSIRSSDAWGLMRDA